MSISTIFLGVIFFLAIDGSTSNDPACKFKCPAKKSKTGQEMTEIMKCYTQFQKIHTSLCTDKFPIKIKLIHSVAKNVLFHALQCIDCDFEHFLLAGPIECFISEKEDGTAGSKMMCHGLKGICDKSLYNPVIDCVTSKITAHKIDVDKLLEKSSHVAELCLLLAKDIHQEIKKFYKDFPAL